MLNQYLRHISLLLILLSFNVPVSADIYKWVDEQGETHYTQSPPPAQHQAELIVTPPPPSIDPNEAQKGIDKLIEQQTSDRQKRLEQEQEKKQQAEQQAIKQQNCQTAKRNLQQTKDNPGRRTVDAEGNVTRLAEEDRQKRIQQFKQQISEYCN